MNDTEIAQSIASLGTGLGAFLPVLQVVSGILGLVVFVLGWLDLNSHRHHGAMMRHSPLSGENAKRGFTAIIVGVLLLTVPQFIEMIASSTALDPRGDVFGAMTVQPGDLLTSVKGFTDVIMTILGVVAVMHGLNLLNATARGEREASFKGGASFILGGVAAIHYNQIIGAIVHTINLPAVTNIYHLVFP